MSSPNGFVADGYERACAALEPEVRAAVLAEYAARLAQAAPWERRRLLREIEREITRRVHEQAPPEALY
jgi:hypothetical protein